eukprot:ctg_511.g285
MCADGPPKAIHPRGQTPAATDRSKCKYGRDGGVMTDLLSTGVDSSTSAGVTRSGASLCMVRCVGICRRGEERGQDRGERCCGAEMSGSAGRCDSLGYCSWTLVRSIKAVSSLGQAPLLRVNDRSVLGSPNRNPSSPSATVTNFARARPLHISPSVLSRQRIAPGLKTAGTLSALPRTLSPHNFRPSFAPLSPPHVPQGDHPRWVQVVCTPHGHLRPGPAVQRYQRGQWQWQVGHPGRRMLRAGHQQLVARGDQGVGDAGVRQLGAVGVAGRLRALSRNHRHPAGGDGRSQQVLGERARGAARTGAQFVSLGAAEREQPALSDYAGPHHQSDQHETDRGAAHAGGGRRHQHVDEINSLLAEEITPSLEKLREERTRYMRWSSNQAEMERLTRLLVVREHAHLARLAHDFEGERAALEAQLATLASDKADLEERLRQLRTSLSDRQVRASKQDADEERALEAQLSDWEKQLVKGEAELGFVRENADGEERAAAEARRACERLTQQLSEVEQRRVEAAMQLEQAEAAHTAAAEALRQLREATAISSHAEQLAQARHQAAEAATAVKSTELALAAKRQDLARLGKRNSRTRNLEAEVARRRKSGRPGEGAAARARLRPTRRTTLA